MVINMADTAYISEGSQSHSQLGWSIAVHANVVKLIIKLQVWSLCMSNRYNSDFKLF